MIDRLGGPPPDPGQGPASSFWRRSRPVFGVPPQAAYPAQRAGHCLQCV